MSDNILHCFYSWGRKEYSQKCFEALLKNVRPQDRVLVIDQEGHNLDIYQGKVDYLFMTKYNYSLGPVWMYIRHFLLWINDLPHTKGNNRLRDFSGKEEIKWQPDYISVLENDGLMNEGCVGKLLLLFQLENVGIVTGYDAPEYKEHETIKVVGNTKIKKTTPCVHMMFKADYFSTLFQYLPYYTQDFEISTNNLNNGKTVACINEIKHIGENGKSQGFVS